MLRVFILLNCLLAAASAAGPLEIDAAVLSAQQQRIEVMQRAATATISIFGLDGGGGGSGVIISADGYALTNYHVSSACGDHMRCGLSDGSMVDAVIVGIDATGDVSLIKLLGQEDFPNAPLADSDQVRVGQWCFAAGNPFMLASNRQPSMSLGIVSGVHRYQYPAGTLLEYADCIQTDAAINPGNSGGPLFNLAGEVIGINGRCSFEKRGRVNVGVGYAISANQVKHFMGVLKSGRLVDHATLGATVSTDASGRIAVSNILNTSDAYRRGLRYGDEVIGLADREIRTANTFKNVLGTLPRDWRVPLEFRRDGETRTILVRLDGVHTEQQLIDLVVPERPAADPSRPSRIPRDSDERGPSAEDAPQPALEKVESEDELDPRLAGLRPDLELVQTMLASRPGFANYYFNKMHQSRLQQQLVSLGDFAKTSPEWILQGKLAGETTAAEIRLEKSLGGMRIGSRQRSVDFAESISQVVEDRMESGLLVALRAMQELLQVGSEQIGDSVYLGTAPVYMSSSRVLGEQPRLDVLQSLWYDARVWFSFRENGELALIEVFGDAGIDPIELYLDQYDSFADSDMTFRFPRRLRLQYGTEPMLLVDLESLAFGTPDEPAPAPAEATPAEAAPAEAESTTAEAANGR